VAVTSLSNGLINDHFGSAEEFLIYEAGDKAIKFIMSRRVETSYCKGPEGCGTYVIDEIKKVLSDCHILLTQKIGDCPRKELDSIKIICDEDYADEPIEISVLKAVKKHFSFEKLKAC
ncbi:MAG: nitrogenase cofactor biosynthesis protein NifB, partial [Campylobacteraceae bacterium]|nr:nitrogenase cofactor biosynthesis protein NifB [Campylobacteraceae bacterium]